MRSRTLSPLVRETTQPAISGLALQKSPTTAGLVSAHLSITGPVAASWRVPSGQRQRLGNPDFLTVSDDGTALQTLLPNLPQPWPRLAALNGQTNRLIARVSEKPTHPELLDWLPINMATAMICRHDAGLRQMSRPHERARPPMELADLAMMAVTMADLSHTDHSEMTGGGVGTEHRLPRHDDCLRALPQPQVRVLQLTGMQHAGDPAAIQRVGDEIAVAREGPWHFPRTARTATPTTSNQRTRFSIDAFIFAKQENKRSAPPARAEGKAVFAGLTRCRPLCRQRWLPENDKHLSMGRYRDWVIQSWNKDKPYDRFTNMADRFHKNRSEMMGGAAHDARAFDVAPGQADVRLLPQPHRPARLWAGELRRDGPWTEDAGKPINDGSAYFYQTSRVILAPFPPLVGHDARRGVAEHGFDNTGDVLTVSPMLTDKYFQMADFHRPIPA